MTNINFEMTYWHAAPGNLTELIMPFFDYFDNALEDFRENAQKIFGCRGIFVPAVSMPGQTRHVCLLPHVTNWIGSLLTRCGVKVSLEWTQNSINVELIATRDAAFELHFPNGHIEQIVMKSAKFLSFNRNI